MNQVRCLNCSKTFPSVGSYAHPAHLCHRLGERPLAPVIPLHRKEES
jgi:hypothetical protein